MDATTRGPWSRDPRSVAALLLLTAAAGGLDAVAFLSLAGTFVSNQTGNVLLLGMSASDTGGADAATTTASLAAFMAGAALAARSVPKVGPGGRWPPSAAAVLAAEVALILLCAGLVGTTDLPQPVLVIPLAAAMGGQTELAKRVGLAYLTGGYVSGTTTTTAMTSPAGDRSDRWWWYGAVALATLATGAALAALVAERSVSGALVILAVGVAAAAVLVRPGPSDPAPSPTR